MAKKVNGDHKVILTRLDTLEEHSKEARGVIFNKLDGIASSVGEIKVSQATEKQKLKDVKDQADKHVNSHKWWVTTLIGIFGGFTALIFLILKLVK